MRGEPSGLELGHLGTQIIGNPAPLGRGGLGVVLGEGGCDEDRDHAPPGLASMGERIALEVDAAALPRCVQYLGNGGFEGGARLPA